jgi:hypothetical protein
MQLQNYMKYIIIIYKFRMEIPILHNENLRQLYSRLVLLR